MINDTIKIKLCLILIVLSGCAPLQSVWEPAPEPQREYVTQRRGAELRRDVQQTSRPQVRPLPWKNWAQGRDLAGTPLRSVAMMESDELAAAGEYSRALKALDQVKAKQLSPQEAEAFLVRKASLLLATDKPTKTLRELSSYLRRQNQRPEEIDERFALLFAYAYGQLRDTEQAFAWFSQAHRSASSGALRSSADQGLRLYLRSLDEQVFPPDLQGWRTDTFIRSAVAREQRRRAAKGYVFTSGSKRFWEVPRDRSDMQFAAASAGAKVGVLLPLSGKYAKLGRSIQRGIELAVTGQGSAAEFDFLFRDTAGDSFQATAAARELLFSDGARLLVGPLLTDAAIAVGEIVRGSGASMIAFSKSSLFRTGEGVFRLGPTIEAQVDSLVSAVADDMQLRRFALAYPHDPEGQEYAEVFRNALLERGLELVYETSYLRGDDSSLVVISQALEDQPVQAIFFPAKLVTAARFYANFTPLMKERMRLLGPASWYQPAELRRSRSVLEGVVFVSPFFAESDQALIQRFNAAYQSEAGSQPDFLAAQGFDAATMAIAALRRASSGEFSFQGAFAAIEQYEGVTGTMTVRDSGEIARTFAVIKMDRGELVAVRNQPAPSYVFHGNEAQEAPGRRHQGSVPVLENRSPRGLTP